MGMLSVFGSWPDPVMDRGHISDGEFWWSPPCFFWAYLYCSLVGWNMGVDPLEWGGAT